MYSNLKFNIKDFVVHIKCIRDYLYNCEGDLKYKEDIKVGEIKVKYKNTLEEVLTIENSIFNNFIQIYNYICFIQLLNSTEFRDILDKEYCKTFKETLVKSIYKESEVLKELAASFEDEKEEKTKKIILKFGTGEGDYTFTGFDDKEFTKRYHEGDLIRYAKGYEFDDNPLNSYCIYEGDLVQHFSIFNVCSLAYGEIIIADFEKFLQYLWLDNNVGCDLREFLANNHDYLISIKVLIIDHLVQHCDEEYNDAVELANTEWLGKVFYEMKNGK